MSIETITILQHLGKSYDLATQPHQLDPFLCRFFKTSHDSDCWLSVRIRSISHISTRS